MFRQDPEIRVAADGRSKKVRILRRARSASDELGQNGRPLELRG